MIKLLDIHSSEMAGKVFARDFVYIALTLNLYSLVGSHSSASSTTVHSDYIRYHTVASLTLCRKI